jgi:glycosyltransferase involved in cell wall biosynthesis
MKIILSSGQGRLHFIEVAQCLHQKGYDVRIITGWVPSKTPRWLVDLLGRVIGRGKDFYASMMKRSPPEFPATSIRTCALSEFVLQGLLLLSTKGVVSRDRAAEVGWIMFGNSSRKYINNADIFHVRSGAGHGNAITQARYQGMRVVVDHSIAHPAEVYRQLKKVSKDDEIRIRPDSRFWRLVLKDCEDADVILVNSEYVKQSFVDEGWDSKRLKVIHWGVREDFIGLKTKYLANGPFRLLFTGSFGDRKGAHLVVQMARSLLEAHIDFNIDIVGSVPRPDRLPDWFTKAPNIHLHGHVIQEELKRFLENSDAYIFPTYSEGAAQSVKEAMAAGLPVITTFNSGAPIEDGKNGILIPVHDADSLVKAVRRLTTDQPLRERLGRAAVQTIAAGHTWAAYASALERLYQDACIQE